jgi:hypothetical protein
MRINNFILFGFVLFGIAGCDEEFEQFGKWRRWNGRSYR